MSDSRGGTIRKIGIVMLFSNLMMGFALTMAQNYASYSYTDLAGIDTSMMATCMFVVNSVAVVITLVSGAIVSSTRSRWGNFRPWLLLANGVCMTGGFLIFFNVGNSMLLKAVIISIGYLFANASMDFIYTARMALIANVAGADSDARNRLVGRQWQGSAVCYIISGFAVVPMVTLLGSGNETLGFLLTQAIFTVIVMGGSIWLFRATKEYDPDNSGSSQKEIEKVKFIEMVKAVVTNRQALTVVLSDIARFTGYYVLASMMVYQCTYVIGSMMAMSYVLMAANFCSFLGATIAPVITPKLGGRKRTIMFFSLLTGAAFVSIGIFGRTLWGFVISCGLAFFFMAFIDTLDSMLYMDAGEYWLYQKGKDTRPYLLSMYNVAVKVALALSSLALGGILTAINYTPGATLGAEGANVLTWATGLAPGVGYLLPLVIMLFHKVSDKEMDVIIKENAERDKG
ncbi:MFS transporter [Blautia producta]|uniref:Putative symporter YjmB n=1 Tax=Blautia producta TaxID=33035 RepID=A0A4V0Z8A5_9FIRM|nr:MFS transporter [Blautia producta]QBE99618.1 putative symporter YjmB [Blautia producta]